MRTPGGLRGLPREAYVLSAVAFSVAVGFGVVAPAIPLLAVRFGVGRGAAAAVVSAFALMRLVSALAAGTLVERIGERRGLALGIGVVAGSSALAGAAGSYDQLLVLRGLGGVGSALFSVSAVSLLYRVVPAGVRGRALSLWTGGFLTGGIAGPAFGGAVAAVSLRAPFYLYAATLAVAGTIALVALRRTPLADPAERGGPGRMTLRQALGHRAYVAALASNAAEGFAVLGLRSAIVPLFVTQALHRDPHWVGYGFFVVAATTGLVLVPAGGWVDRVGRRPLMVGGLVLSAGALALLAVDASVVTYLAAMLLLGLGGGLLDVAPAAVVADVSGGRGGRVVAAAQMATDVGTVSGPVVAGTLADLASFGAAFGCAAGLLAAAAAVAVTAPETLPRREPASAGGGQGRGQVGDEVLGVLEAHGQAHEVGGDLEG